MVVIYLKIPFVKGIAKNYIHNFHAVKILSVIVLIFFIICSIIKTIFFESELFMIKIMFVCHGNICRSPCAEFVFRKLIAEKHLSDKYFVASSATSTEEIYMGVGNPVYPPMRAELSKHGIDCTGKRAVQLKPSDADKYDLFIGMDSANIRNMHRILPSSAHGKIKKLLEYAGRNSDVSDPWYSGEFDVAYRDILEGCTALLENTEKQNNI